MLQRLVIRNRFLSSTSTLSWIISSSTNSSNNVLSTSQGDYLSKQKISVREEKNKSNTWYGLYSTFHFESGLRCFSSDANANIIDRSDVNTNVDVNDPLCPGCGVYMQSKDSKAPGFFLPSSNTSLIPHKHRHKLWVDVEPSQNLDQIILLDPDEEQPQKFTARNEEQGGPGKPVVCARCHSLRSYGKVKDESVENLLPDFDFEVTVGPRLMHTKGTRSTVLMVVDSVDFDGSFPRRAARLVSQAIEEGTSAWKEGKSGNVPRLVVAATKLDLLPTHLVTPERLEKWVRQRARIAGAVKLQGVHLVSARKGWGIDNLTEHIKQLAGPRGNVWVIGAQNAGKSTLINAIGKHVGNGKSVTQLTQAPVPGTTLGIIRVQGILPDKANLFDTPGILHPHQMSTRLNREEQKLIHISKELKPRTYRLKVGQSVHVGGLMRVDIEKSSVETIYLTIWASPLVPLHLGKEENADMLKERHFGLQLQPPVSQERVSELGEWQKRELQVSGNSWDFNSVDIATAGIGWLSVGLKGDATLAVWTYDGVDITLRDALILDRARFFENSGFTVSSIVSKADKKQKNAEVKNKDGGKKSNDSKGKNDDSKIMMEPENN
ncbi:hypothetical protein SUGI_1173220 [Cryptomeria japonica]|uniref:GTP-binding protein BRASSINAZOLE INSENSITIVE PALE GREEN 2, chloroplastic n=1 Tax=Cryptomeria japonica TaxID=3369 RepID=UPI0024147490|nr:GTP-binding protein BRASSINAZOLE INSENSITIVE PALE GREEN 2, chloroplastic [Cryptomeria japonica]GLJ54613.1 hypothetical protein SUGI_1173220 [Cryptomeria japonica]